MSYNSRRYSRSQNHTAGANRESKDARGKHSHSKRYVPGDNLVECQRCGHDIYASDARYDGYTKGLIVCPQCYDPPHPQDYVRAYEDTITPAGPVTGAAEYSTTGATGSTALPAGGFEPSGNATDMPNQSNDAGDTISTVSAATYFPTSVFSSLNGVTYTPTFTATGLPDGLSISSSGDITGTIDSDAWDESPNSVVVTAYYVDGYVLPSNTWTWTVANAGLAPDALSTSLYGWYDFSLPTWSFTDSGGTTEVTDESNQERVNSRDASPSGKQLVREGSAANGVWDANVQNGLGAFFATLGGPSNAADLSANNPFTGPTLPQTVVGIVQIPAGDTVTRYWFGSDVTNGQQIGLSTNANGFAPELESQRTNPTPAQTVTRGSSSHAAYAGDWQMWMVEYVDSTTTTITINNVDMAGGAIAHNHLDLATTGVAIGNQNINTSDNPYYAWNAYIGEVIVYDGLLSAADKAALYTFLKAKWTLSSYP